MGRQKCSRRRVIVNCVLAVMLAILPVPALAAEPERPRVYLDTTYVPPTGRTIAVAAGGDVQAALNAAKPGDVITLEAGAIFRGPFTLPNKTGSGWIIVRTSAPDSSLPSPGMRVNPSYATVMPKVVVGSGMGGAIRTAPGAHHFRFIGVEVKPTVGAFVHSLIDLGAGRETSEATLPHDIIVDRCYIHGDPIRGGRRGIALNGKALAVIDSYLSDFKEVGADSQALMGWNGPGPFKIVNNYLEAAGENVMFGGADPSIVNLVPADIEIQANHFFKPLTWRIGDPSYAGTPWSVKNLFELKNARRVLIEGNIFENNWLHAQDGFAILLTVRNQYGTAPWSTIEDVTFRKNIVRHSGSGINILATDDPNRSQTLARVLIQDNLFEDIDSVRWVAGGANRLFQILDYAGRGATHVIIDHNTGFITGADSSLLYTEKIPHTGFIYRNNLTLKGAYGVLGAGTGEGSPTLNRYFPGAVFTRNILVGANPSIYPANNFFPASLDKVGFVDREGGNYRLSASSPHKNAGTDGRDIGANIDALRLLSTVGVQRK